MNGVPAEPAAEIPQVAAERSAFSLVPVDPSTLVDGRSRFVARGEAKHQFRSCICERSPIGPIR
jgi:hypothetical protein